MEHSRPTHPDPPAPIPKPPPVPVLTIAYTPLQDAVVVLGTSGSGWVMHLDADSPAEDHVWALLEALEILAHHGDTAGTAYPPRHLHLVPPPATTTR